LVQSGENDWQNYCHVITHQVDNVLVIPVVQSAFRYLEVLAIDAPRKLLEQSDLDLLKLGGINHI
jgi:hypothetical protein